MIIVPGHNIIVKIYIILKFNTCHLYLETYLPVCEQ
jgi:hypothetical protein